MKTTANVILIIAALLIFTSIFAMAFQAIASLWLFTAGFLLSLLGLALLDTALENEYASTQSTTNLY
jgi:hypothetical protein